jgi:hypothetical protein
MSLECHLGTILLRLHLVYTDINVIVLHDYTILATVREALAEDAPLPFWGERYPLGKQVVNTIVAFR